MPKSKLETQSIIAEGMTDYDSESEVETELDLRAMPEQRANGPYTPEQQREFIDRLRALVKDVDYHFIDIEDDYVENSETRKFMEDRMREIIASLVKEKIEEVVLLDKGARFLGYFLKNAWRALNIAEPCPNLSFVNIGREKMLYNISYNNPDAFIDGAMSKREARNMDTLVSNVQAVFGDKFVGKRIAIIDEFFESGGSLLLANEVFKRAYPEAEIFGEWFAIGESSDPEQYDGNISRLSGNHRGKGFVWLKIHDIADAEDNEAVVSVSAAKHPTEDRERQKADSLEKRREILKMVVEMVDRDTKEIDKL